jgi:HlyD family secretion protein
MGGTAFGLGWLALAQTEEIVVAPGKLEPISRVVDVQMPLQGVTKRILVKEGERVTKGQVLIQLDTEASKDRQKATLEALRLKSSELGFKNQELNNTLVLSRTRISSLQESLVLGRQVMNRFASLAKQGAAAELQYLEQRNKVQQLEGEIRQTEADRKRQVSVLEQNIQSLKSQIAELNSKITEGSVTLRYQEIVSPVDGIVFDLKPRGAGFVAQTSEPILQIVPIDKLQAKVEIDSRTIGFVSVGKQADISIDSYPASDFGVLQGEVTRIGSDALPPEPAQNKGYRFPANITLKSQQLLLKDGKKLPLQVGMSLTANIKLRKVTYLQLLLGSFRQKADSLRSL